MLRYKRILNLNSLLEKKSFFLLGPRATGKTSLIKSQLTNQSFIIDLLNSDLYLQLSSRPTLLEELIANQPYTTVVIDEIQRIPELLNEVHRLIEAKGCRFLLTGSSARKLRTGKVNLLAGRAWEAHLFPLVTPEFNNFNLSKYLHIGGLPAVYSSQDPQEELLAYINTYLKEEIQAEAIIRKLPAFSRFLQLSAITSGQMIKFSNIARDAMVPVSTIREYYHVLEDTLVGFMLPAWTKSVKRKAISTAKFYYFDIGVRNSLTRISHVEQNTDLFGQLFKHFIILEVRAYLDYTRKHAAISYWRSKNGHEVDLIINDEIAIEIKSTITANNTDLKNLKYLAEEKICSEYILVSQDNIERKHNNPSIRLMHWQTFLEKLWNGEIY